MVKFVKVWFLEYKPLSITGHFVHLYEIKQSEIVHKKRDMYNIYRTSL